MLGERALHLRGIDVHAAGDDRVVLAIDEREPTLLVDGPEIADGDVTVAGIERCDRLAVVREISRHDRGRAYEDFPVDDPQ